ncbi:hypothetical protein Bbelb_296890 [Branchiostoma belcheri]|nr:hypothetical protein Bbelb_296890 [Branchiostoma belcheri]
MACKGQFWRLLLEENHAGESCRKKVLNGNYVAPDILLRDDCVCEMANGGLNNVLLEPRTVSLVITRTTVKNVIAAGYDMKGSYNVISLFRIQISVFRLCRR